MSNRPFLSAVCTALISMSLAGGCQHKPDTTDQISIQGFSDINYTALNRGLGSHVCVYGRVVVDRFHGGVYFPLQPHMKDGIITVDPSRVVSGLSYNYTQSRQVRNGNKYRICGILQDATPFPKCNNNYCKWYKLTDAVLRN